MEKCEVSLTQVMGSIRTLAPPYRTRADVSRTFREIALGLNFVHSMGVLHRDVQPANIFLGGRDGRTAKLGGFGLAAALPQASFLEEACSTPIAFSPPELLNAQPYHQPMDVWSFGVTLHLVMYGSYPYVAQSNFWTMKRSIVANKPPPSFSCSDGTCDLKLEARASSLVKKMLHHDAASRCSLDDLLCHSFLEPTCDTARTAAASAENYHLLRSQTILRSSTRAGATLRASASVCSDTSSSTTRSTRLGAPLAKLSDNVSLSTDAGSSAFSSEISVSSRNPRRSRII